MYDISVYLKSTNSKHSVKLLSYTIQIVHTRKPNILKHIQAWNIYKIYRRAFPCLLMEQINICLNFVKLNYKLKLNGYKITNIFLGWFFK